MCQTIKVVRDNFSLSMNTTVLHDLWRIFCLSHSVKENHIQLKLFICFHKIWWNFLNDVTKQILSLFVTGKKSLAKVFVCVTKICKSLVRHKLFLIFVYLTTDSLAWKTWNGPGISAVRGPHSTTWNTISWTQQNYL